MADLIDRKHFDKALEDVLVVSSGKLALGEGSRLVNELTLDYISQVREWLKEEPTVDAVPVVRCKDCKYFCGDGVSSAPPYICGLRSFSGHDEITDDNDFCSLAEPVNKLVESVDTCGI